MTKRSVYISVLSFSLIWVILYLITWKYYWLIAGGSVLLLTIYFPIAKAIATGWMAFSSVLGKVNSTIILSVIYLFILTPFSFLKRLFSGRPKVGYVTRNHAFSKEDFEKPW